PLFYHILSTLEKCASVDQIVVDTDSPVIMEKAGKDFPGVIILERPKELQADDVAMNDVLLNSTSQVSSEFYLQVHSTNPLLRAETIDRAVQTFLDRIPMYDSLFGVTRLQARLWDELGRAINHNPDILLRTQDLPPTYLENSCLYLFKKETLQDKHNRIGRRPFLFELDRIESWDIDEEVDFRVAELLFRQERGEA
ncbi:MAG TPA: acylneuraminate cytidylyltransferase family protein, partial [Nitrospiria bacterium]|nr:acylneuraminate cytidylyltransferase family protein [Nitrospiria bacterium]